jgi:hypothetical protein
VHEPPETAAPPPSQAGSKAGRNERRKLAATAFNNGGVAAGLAASIQPLIFYLQTRRELDFQTVGGSLILLVAAGGCFAVAQAIAARLED